jgi:hypothetical protein
VPKWDFAPVVVMVRSAHAIGQSIGSPNLNGSSAQLIDTGFFRYDKTTINDQKVAAVRYQ